MVVRLDWRPDQPTPRRRPPRPLLLLHRPRPRHRLPSRELWVLEAVVAQRRSTSMMYTTCMSTQIRLEPSLAEFGAAAEVLKLVADPTRLHLLWTLVGGEHTVSALADVVGARPAAVSQHLAKLRLGNLVTTRRDGNHIHYSLVNQHVARLVGESLLEADHLVGGASHHEDRDR